MTPPRWLLPLLSLWALAPLAVLVLRAVAQAWYFPQLFPPVDGWPSMPPATGARVAASLLTSLELAVATGMGSAAAGFLMARGIVQAGRRAKRVALALALLAVVAPPMGLGVGLQVAMLTAGVGGTATGVWLAHLVPATGYVTLFAFGVLTTFDQTLGDEARTLGASRWQVWSRVLVPLLRGRLAEGAVLGGLVSWGQLAITLLIGGGLVRTLPLELLSLVQSGNDQAGALAALVLTLPPLAAIGVLRLGAARTGAGL